MIAELLKKRFFDDMARHPGMAWEDVETRLCGSAESYHSVRR